MSPVCVGFDKSTGNSPGDLITSGEVIFSTYAFLYRGSTCNSRSSSHCSTDAQHQVKHPQWTVLVMQVLLELRISHQHSMQLSKFLPLLLQSSNIFRH